MKPVPVLMSWSGGKDGVLALDALRRDPGFQVVGLASGFCRETGRIAIHEVRRELIREQADSLSLPLNEVDLPEGATNEVYEANWRRLFETRRAEGIEHVAFGDLFLRDIRAYRERFLGSIGMHALFPLWGRATPSLARDALENGLQAVVCSCDPLRLDRRFAGRLFDRRLIDDLPAGCDPCGENGEFHTFVFDGPGFSRPVRWSLGEVSRRGTVDFCDLLPVQPQ